MIMIDITLWECITSRLSQLYMKKKKAQEKNLLLNYNIYKNIVLGI